MSISYYKLYALLFGKMSNSTALDENRLNLMVPRFPIKKELYEYSPKLLLKNKSTPVHFDIIFIHNNEPQHDENYQALLSAVEGKT
jgi:hypothetical protein